MLVLGLRDLLGPLPKEKRSDKRNGKKMMHLINFIHEKGTIGQSIEGEKSIIGTFGERIKHHHC